MEELKFARSETQPHTEADGNCALHAVLGALIVLSFVILIICFLFFIDQLVKNERRRDPTGFHLLAADDHGLLR